MAPRYTAKYTDKGVPAGIGLEPIGCCQEAAGSSFPEPRDSLPPSLEGHWSGPVCL